MTAQDNINNEDTNKYNLFNLMSYQTCITLFLMLNTKEDILKNVGIFFGCIIIILNIFFCVLQKTKSHTGLVQDEVE